VRDIFRGDHTLPRESVFYPRRVRKQRWEEARRGAEFAELCKGEERGRWEGTKFEYAPAVNTISRNIVTRVKPIFERS